MQSYKIQIPVLEILENFLKKTSVLVASGRPLHVLKLKCTAIAFQGISKAATTQDIFNRLLLSLLFQLMSLSKFILNYNFMFSFKFFRLVFPEHLSRNLRRKRNFKRNSLTKTRIQFTCTKNIENRVKQCEDLKKLNSFSKNCFSAQSQRPRWCVGFGRTPQNFKGPFHR